MIKKLQFEPLPGLKDPRWPFFATLTTYVVLGITVLGFNRSLTQILITVFSTIALDVIFSVLLRNGKVPVPLSAAISGMGLSILVNYSHGYWIPLVPVFFTVASKYLITFKGRHVFNPTLFGVFLSLKLGGSMMSVSPAYQWGGSVAMAIFIVTAALVLFVFRIHRTYLILSFLGFYGLQLGLRAWLTRYHIPPETLLLGALTQPAFYLFTFFMITDPKTSPSRPRDQVLMSLIIVVIDLILHRKQMLSTLFFAGFVYFTLKWFYLHLQNIRPHFKAVIEGLPGYLGRVAVVLTFGGLAYGSYHRWIAFHDTLQLDFHFEKLDTEAAGIRSRPGDVFQKLDPKIAHIAKWPLSVGDAIAVGDIDGDGRPDLFLTYPLKDAKDRAALYRNLGNYKFERVPIPELDALTAAPEIYGHHY